MGCLDVILMGVALIFSLIVLSIVWVASPVLAIFIIFIGIGAIWLFNRFLNKL